MEKWLAKLEFLKNMVAKLKNVMEQDGAASESSSSRPGIVKIFSFSQTWDFGHWTIRHGTWDIEIWKYWRVVIFRGRGNKKGLGKPSKK